ncbi:MAG: Nucleotidyltransferase [Ignavibacteria bacterium]|nr:Nucleotidyltransferase [Ignavibacteria bacterium]
MTKENIIDELNRNNEILERFHVKSLALFGSFSIGTSSLASDIDFLVNFNQNTFRNFIGLRDFLEELLHHKIDLVCENSLKDSIKPYILKEAIWLKN